MNTLEIVRAFEFSSLQHQHQKRKGIKEYPYLSHVAVVAALLAHYNYSQEVIVAGVLHDTIEDTQTTYEELVLHFGKEVADLVMDVTEDKKLPYREMKYSYIDHIKKPETRSEAAAISCCDLIANLNSLVLEEEHVAGYVRALYGNNAENFKKLITYRRDVVAEKIGEVSPPVVELDLVLKKVFDLLSD